ncbi:MAG: QueT transporter family protein [Erysipelotrichaceae bacterium]|nr:QueT transporter family protein [Erysipelotrichaceae bacterium]
MKKLDVKMIALNAMVACVYAVMTIACSAISYGGIQFRISEVLIFLAFYNKKYFPGLIIGCFLANIPSSLGIYDMVFGTLATALACVAMYKANNLYVGAILGGIINGSIVGAELYFILDLPFLFNAFTVFLGEVAVLIIGAILFKLLEKNTTFMNRYIKE